MGESLISPDKVLHVAKLARLALSPDELPRYAAQLESILEYVDTLRRVDLSATPPMAHAVPLHNVLREDVVEPSLRVEQVLQNAPDSEGAFFKVPKILGGDEDSAG